MVSTDFTDVAPATNISIVLALVKLDNVAMNRIVAIIMTIIRGVPPLKALQITTGANRKTIMRDANSVRVACFIKEPEYMYTFESLEIS
jgi:hypothetical protein